MTALEKAMNYLKSASLKGSVLGLSRIKELLRLMGEPQNSLKIVHVAGTNGKGSFTAMLSSVLTAAGYKTGVFSSPALTGVTDSFRVDGVTISDEAFAEAMLEIEKISAEMEMNDGPTEFEALTAAAFLIFKKSGCDICVVECGLGGDADSTNVAEKPVLSVITNVRKDHCQILGDTIAEIAAHKAGIIKKGCPVLYGGEDEAFAVIKAKAEEMGSPIYRTDLAQLSNIVYDKHTTFDFGKLTELELSLLGTYQPENAANAITALEILKKSGFDKINEAAIRKGLSECVWKGRFEKLCGDPAVIFDGSHNPDGMSRTAESMRRYFGDRKAAVLMGVMADKEYELYADMLRDVTEKVFTVTPDNPRALDSKALAGYFNENGISAEAFEDFGEGVRSALQYAKEKKLPLMAIGTLYMYKQFTNYIKAF